jgi:hypothetical protein
MSLQNLHGRQVVDIMKKYILSLNIKSIETQFTGQKNIINFGGVITLRITVNLMNVAGYNNDLCLWIINNVRNSYNIFRCALFEM